MDVPGASTTYTVWITTGDCDVPLRVSHLGRRLGNRLAPGRRDRAEGVVVAHDRGLHPDLRAAQGGEWRGVQAGGRAGGRGTPRRGFQSPIRRPPDRVLRAERSQGRPGYGP